MADLRHIRGGLRRLAVVVVGALAVPAVLLVLGPPAGAANPSIIVQDSGDAAPNAADCLNNATPTACSLRDAFAKANADAGDDVIDIQLGSATISLSGQLVHSPGDNAALTVLGNGATVEQGGLNLRVMQSTSTGMLTIDNITLSGGNQIGNRGGAIRATGAIVVTNSVLTGNSAQFNGGAIEADNGPVTVTNSTITQNTSTSGQGGAISSRGDITINGSTIGPTNHSAFNGGGLWAEDGLVTVTNSTITTNTSGTNGGGIYALNVSIVNSTIDHNTASSTGGGVRSIVDISVTNSTISDNTAASGGGIFVNDGDTTLVYATIASNSAGSGANLNLNNDPLTSFGSVIALPLGGGTDCAAISSTTSNGWNWDSDGTCGFGAGTGDHSSGGDPLLGALANNGGSTQTRLPQSGSGLINAIPASDCADDGAALITTDQIGTTRPQSTGCEIGALEIPLIVAPLVAAFTG